MPRKSALNKPAVSSPSGEIDGFGVKCDRYPAQSDAANMYQNLASQPKIRTIIPLEPGETQGSSTETVILNGLRINILKGEFVDLPEQVAQVIQDSFHQTRRAIHDAVVVSPLTGEEHPALTSKRSAGEKDAFTA